MKFDDLMVALTYLTPIILLCGIAGALYNLKNLKNTFYLLFIYIVVALSTDILGRVFGIYLQNNLILIPLFALAELAIFYIIYSKYLKINHSFFKIFLIVTIGLVGFEIYSMNYLSPGYFHAYSKVASTFTITTMCMVFLYQKNKADSTEMPLLQRFNLVTLMYFSLTLVLFLPVNYLVNEKSKIIFYFWMFNLLVTSLYYGYISYLLWKNGKTQRQLQSG